MTAPRPHDLKTIFADAQVMALLAIADIPSETTREKFGADQLSVALQAVMVAWDAHGRGLPKQEVGSLLSEKESADYCAQVTMAIAALILNAASTTCHTVDAHGKPITVPLVQVATHWAMRIGKVLQAMVLQRIEGVAAPVMEFEHRDGEISAKRFDFRDHLKGGV